MSTAEAPPRGEAARRGGSVRAAERALAILGVFARGQQPEWALEDIARACELPKSTTHRLLDTLVRQGFVALGRRPGSYRLGLQAAVVGSAAIRSRRPRQDIQELLRKAVDQVGETVGLSVRDGRAAIQVDRVASPRPLHWRLNIGDSLPAHESAAGKVLLASLGDDAVRELYAGMDILPKATPHTISSVAQLIDALGPVRRLGYALDAEEHELGLRCVSVPVRGVSGRVTLAMTMSAPASRVDLERIEQPVRTLMRIAAEIAPHVELDVEA